MDDKLALFVNSKRLALVRYCVNEQKLRGVFRTSALPPKADIAERDRNVRFVPIADIGPRVHRGWQQ